MHPNIQTVLDVSRVPYKLHLHNSFTRDIQHPLDFAHALGVDMHRITKAVFICSVSKDQYAMGVCSVNLKLNFFELARLLNCKKVEVASKAALHQLVGYPVHGVSPIGLQGIPVFIDDKLLALDSIFIGAGVAGEEIEIAPADLQKISSGRIVSITQ